MRPLLLTAVLLALALALAGAASAQVVSDNPLHEVNRPYEYNNAEGEFTVTWPGGCAKLRRRSNEPPPDADPFTTVRVVHVSCDRHGEEGQGCSVAAIFNQLAEDGGIAGPDEVVDRLEEQLERFQVQVVEQTPITKEFDDGSRVEGLDIKAMDARHVGEVWLRGLLFRGDIYVLSAWDLGGGVWDDPEYQDFFASFRPGVE